jgi:hypothetical protein
MTDRDIFFFFVGAICSMIIPAVYGQYQHSISWIIGIVVSFFICTIISKLLETK